MCALRKECVVNMRKLMMILMAFIMCLSLSACGSDNQDEEVINDEIITDDGVITLEDLRGYWSPVQGFDETLSVLTCIYIDDSGEYWEEYDKYGELTGCSGAAYTDGVTLTLKDVPLIGDAEVPIGDEDTLFDENGEVYWVKGYPDFLTKPELSSDYYGKWYLKGDRESSFMVVLTLREDSTYTRYEGEEGTYTYREYDENNNGEMVFRKEIALSSSMNEMYYLEADGQVLVYWANHGDNYYIHERALDNEDLLITYSLYGNSFYGDEYTLNFMEDNTLTMEYQSGEENRNGIFNVEDGMILITWDDGETDEADLNYKDLYLYSTGETLNNPW